MIDKIDWLKVKEIIYLALVALGLVLVIFADIAIIKNGEFSDKMKPHWEKREKKNRRKDKGVHGHSTDLRAYHPANRALLEENPKWLEMLGGARR